MAVVPGGRLHRDAAPKVGSCTTVNNESACGENPPHSREPMNDEAYAAHQYIVHIIDALFCLTVALTVTTTAPAPLLRP